jgi:hypothetical protein
MVSLEALVICVTICFIEIVMSKDYKNDSR